MFEYIGMNIHNIFMTGKYYLLHLKCIQQNKTALMSFSMRF